jgi:hypothetical protein
MKINWALALIVTKIIVRPVAPGAPAGVTADSVVAHNHSFCGFAQNPLYMSKTSASKGEFNILSVTAK